MLEEVCVWGEGSTIAREIMREKNKCGRKTNAEEKNRRNKHMQEPKMQEHKMQDNNRNGTKSKRTDE